MGKLISVIGKNLPVKPMDFLEYMNLLLDSGAPQFIEKDADAFITFCASDGYGYYGYDDYGNKYKVPIYYDKASRTEFVFKEACTNLFLTFAAIACLKFLGFLLAINLKNPKKLSIGTTLWNSTGLEG